LKQLDAKTEAKVGQEIPEHAIVRRLESLFSLKLGHSRQKPAHPSRLELNKALNDDCEPPQVRERTGETSPSEASSNPGKGCGVSPCEILLLQHESLQ
jgi:hypothetical protein